MNVTNCSVACDNSVGTKIMAEFCFEKVGVPVVGFMGLVGNIAAIVVLRWHISISIDFYL